MIFRGLERGSTEVVNQWIENCPFLKKMIEVFILDDATKEQLENGQRITELFKQTQFSPRSVACISIVLYAIENKYLSNVEKEKMQSFEENLRTHLKSNYGDVWEEVNKTGDWNDDLDKKYKEILDTFMKEGSW